MCLAVPGKIISIQSDSEIGRCGRVDFDGVVREVNLSCVPESAPGDYVLVHAGVAIGRLDEGEAKRTLALLRELIESAPEGGHEAS